MNLSGGITLAFVVPVIVCLLRPLYERTRAPAISLPEHATLNSETYHDHLDVYITVGSWVIEAIAYIVVGAATTLTTQIIGKC